MENRGKSRVILLPELVTDTLLELVDERNLTVHVYDLATAERVCETIADYFFVFEEVSMLHKLK